MECKCKKDHVIGRIIREFLVRPTPLCAAVGPMIRKIGRLELSCYCGYCRSEKLCFDIEFPQLPGRRDAWAQTRRIALVREPFCCKALVDIRMHLDGPNLINFDYYDASDRQYGRVWECKLRNGHAWYSHYDARPRVMVETWRRVADFVDIDSLVEVPRDA